MGSGGPTPCPCQCPARLPSSPEGAMRGLRPPSPRRHSAWGCAPPFISSQSCFGCLRCPGPPWNLQNPNEPPRAFLCGAFWSPHFSVLTTKGVGVRGQGTAPSLPGSSPWAPQRRSAGLSHVCPGWSECVLRCRVDKGSVWTLGTLCCSCGTGEARRPLAEQTVGGHHVFLLCVDGAGQGGQSGSWLGMCLAVSDSCQPGNRARGFLPSQCRGGGGCLCPCSAA